jgi:hypothetical protein
MLQRMSRKVRVVILATLCCATLALPTPPTCGPQQATETRCRRCLHQPSWTEPLRGEWAHPVSIVRRRNREPVRISVPNDERSHAGPTASDCKQDAVPALAGAIGWATVSFQTMESLLDKFSAWNAEGETLQLRHFAKNIVNLTAPR